MDALAQALGLSMTLEHQYRTTRHYEPMLGFCCCRFCVNLPYFVTEKSTMSGDNIVALVCGLTQANPVDPPLRVTVPAGTNLSEIADEGENMTLETRIKDCHPDIKEVVVGKGKGVSIESIGQEQRAQNRGG